MYNASLEELLILTKTYPNPSTKYRETTCVAALTSENEMRRLYPVPFRLLEGEHQFKKWEWIQVNVSNAKGDNRPESRHIDVDTIVRPGRKIGTEHGWRERQPWITPHIVEDFNALESRRQSTGQTLGFLRPNRLLELEITPVKNPNWTDEDKAKLLKDGLFDSKDVKARTPLRKLPYDFHYHYECKSAAGVQTLRHKLTDWEAGALYWKCFHRHGAKWEKAFRQMLEVNFAKKDLLFLMGTIHRFPDQWLIVGLVYPPKQEQDEGVQLSLDLGE
jgi:hypothetical protein